MILYFLLRPWTSIAFAILFRQYIEIFDYILLCVVPTLGDLPFKLFNSIKLPVILV